MESRRETELAAAVDDVWECVTDPALLSTWLDGDLDVDGDVVEPGAAATFTDADGTVRHVLVDDVDPGRRTLAWTWWTDDESEPPSSVAITLEPLPASVRVVVVERQLVVAGPVPRAMAMA